MLSSLSTTVRFRNVCSRTKACCHCSSCALHCRVAHMCSCYQCDNFDCWSRFTGGWGRRINHSHVRDDGTLFYPPRAEQIYELRRSCVDCGNNNWSGHWWSSCASWLGEYGAFFAARHAKAYLALDLLDQPSAGCYMFSTYNRLSTPGRQTERVIDIQPRTV